jgi:hypothetical protein
VTVLALATLGSATKNRNDPICVALSKVAKASMMMWLLCVAVADSFANKLRQCKQSIMDHLHWRHLLAKPSETVTHDCTCLGHLGQLDSQGKYYTAWYCGHNCVRYCSKICQCKQSMRDWLKLQCFLFVLLWSPWYSCCWQAPRSVWLILVLGTSKKHKQQHIMCNGYKCGICMTYLV